VCRATHESGGLNRLRQEAALVNPKSVRGARPLNWSPLIGRVEKLPAQDCVPKLLTGTRMRA
jgi:hypothetical protein